MPKVNWNIPELKENEQLVWIRPASYLYAVPHPCYEHYSAYVGSRTAIKKLEKGEKTCWDAGSYREIKNRIISGKPIDALMLDYTRMVGKWPTHEGRHRALVCMALGVDYVPVIVKKP